VSYSVVSTNHILLGSLFTPGQWSSHLDIFNLTDDKIPSV